MSTIEEYEIRFGQFSRGFSETLNFADTNPFQSQLSPNVNVGFTGKNDVRTQALGIFETSLSAIPAKSVIVNAYFQVRASLTTATGDMDIDVAIVPPGKWSNPVVPSGTHGYNPITPTFGVGIKVDSGGASSDFGGFTFLTNGISGLGLAFAGDGDDAVWPVSFTQGLNMPGTGTLDLVQLEARKIGTPVGSSFIEIYQPLSGTPYGHDIPDIAGGVLATSDTLLNSSYPTALGPTQYVFSGAERIDITEEKYIVKLEPGYLNGLLNRIEWAYKIDLLPADANNVVVATGTGDGEWATVSGIAADFNAVNYPTAAEAPALSLSTNYFEHLSVAPSGSIVTITVPDMTSGVSYQLGNISPLIQEVVSAPWYDGSQDLAFILAPGESASASVPDERNWNNQATASGDPWSLVVEYREPKIYVT